MARRYERKKPMAEMNIVPYVDVMLVLLVIFMVCTPLLTQGVAVDLPQASAKVLDAEEKEPIVVTVDNSGLYYLNLNENAEQSINPQDLIVRVAAELERDPKRKVLVRGDKAVPYGDIVTAMVLLQQSGAGSVGLITASPKQEIIRRKK